MHLLFLVSFVKIICNEYDKKIDQVKTRSKVIFDHKKQALLYANINSFR